MWYWQVTPFVFPKFIWQPRKRNLALKSFIKCDQQPAWLNITYDVESTIKHQSSIHPSIQVCLWQPFHGLFDTRNLSTCQNDDVSSLLLVRRLPWCHYDGALNLKPPWGSIMVSQSCPNILIYHFSYKEATCGSSWPCVFSLSLHGIHSLF